MTGYCKMKNDYHNKVIQFWFNNNATNNLDLHSTTTLTSPEVMALWLIHL